MSHLVYTSCGRCFIYSALNQVIGMATETGLNATSDLQLSAAKGVGAICAGNIDAVTVVKQTARYHLEFLGSYFCVQISLNTAGKLLIKYGPYLNVTP